MSVSIYQPGGALRRITQNAGNRRWIRGGFINRSMVRAGDPVFIGPSIPNQSFTIGTPFDVDLSVYFSGNGTYALDSPGAVPAWCTINPVTGHLIGTPNASGTFNDIVCDLTRADVVAISNLFSITAAP